MKSKDVAANGWSGPGNVWALMKVLLAPAAVIMAGAVLAASEAFAAASGGDVPNILLIIADDYGTDDCSLYNSVQSGASLPPTPNLTLLAQSGVVFRHAYANPMCSPTRCCIMTGRHTFRTGVGDVIAGASDPALTQSEFTLPDAFAANSRLGYAYAQFGKWHLHTGPNSPRVIGGWQHFAGSIAGQLASYTSWTKNVNGVSTANYTNYATTDVVDDAIAWMQAQGTRPWFAWVAFNAPHIPYHKPPAHLCPHYASLSGTQADINAPITTRSRWRWAVTRTTTSSPPSPVKCEVAVDSA